MCVDFSSQVSGFEHAAVRGWTAEIETIAETKRERENSWVVTVIYFIHQLFLNFVYLSLGGGLW